MKLYLYGHDYKYAAEQMMLSLYPSERPEYPEGKPEGDRVELRLSNGNIYTTASCRLVLNSVEYKAKSSVKTGLMIDDISRDKLCSRIIKPRFTAQPSARDISSRHGECSPEFAPESSSARSLRAKRRMLH